MTKLYELSKYSFISKAPREYLKQLKKKKKKKTLQGHSARILIEFAENHTFSVQDEIQSFETRGNVPDTSGNLNFKVFLYFILRLGSWCGIFLLS